MGETVISHSEKGIMVNGIKYKSFEDYVESLPLVRYDDAITLNQKRNAIRTKRIKQKCHESQD